MTTPIDDLPFGPYDDHDVELALGVDAMIRVSRGVPPKIVRLTIASVDGISGTDLRKLPLARWIPNALGFKPLRHNIVRRSGVIPEKEVSETYIHALERGARPAQAVVDVFGVPQSTATYWIRAARDAGLIPEEDA